MNRRTIPTTFLPLMGKLNRAGNRALPLAFLALFFTLNSSCSQDGSEFHFSAGDIRPPSILDARQTDPGVFRIVFDEEVVAVPESFGFTPAGSRLDPTALENTIDIRIVPAAPPGQECEISGEARDSSGNTCRFLFAFAAYNATPAALVMTELQTGKNTSQSSPHRDYVEFLVMGAGNLGGICIQWASSVKLMEHIFPTCEVEVGDVIVLHCAPEGLAGEINELGEDTSLSVGVDASVNGRDFWTQAGGLPDETGVVVTRPRSGSIPSDGLLYASMDKTGVVAEGKLKVLAMEFRDASLWTLSEPLVWEEFFLWKSSSARPLHRKLGASRGPIQWYVGESGTQSPGRAEPGIAKRQGRKPQ